MKWVNNRLLNNCTLTTICCFKYVPVEDVFFFNMMCENLNLDLRSPNFFAGQSISILRELGQDQAAMQVMSLTNSEQSSHVCQRRHGCYAGSWFLVTFHLREHKSAENQKGSSCLFASSQEGHVHSFPHVRLVVSMLKPFTKLIKVC